MRTHRPPHPRIPNILHALSIGDKEVCYRRRYGKKKQGTKRNENK